MTYPDNLYLSQILLFLPQKHSDILTMRQAMGSFEAVFRSLYKEPDIDSLLQAESELLLKEEISLISIVDKDYPVLLAQIPDPPILLYIKGKFPEAKNYLSVVGSRIFSGYGKATIDSLIPSLIELGIVIVSGLALGIDALAHEQTLKSGGKTIAVLGGGLAASAMYPKENLELAKQIVENDGCLISEYHPLTKPTKYSFPERNRIIAGLCQTTCVIECREKSGALITADFALDYNRSLCAVPGSIFNPFSAGPNYLISQGATPVLKPQDIASLYNLEINQPDMEKQKLSPDEQKILEILNGQSYTKDEIIARNLFPPSKALSILLQLEIKNLIIIDDTGEIIVSK